MPFIGHMFDRVRITSPCHGHVNTWFYLNLVDVADNTENTINIDSGDCNEGIIGKYPCPKTITQNVVKVLR